MKTLSPTQARVNLTSWLKKAAAGEDIGILCGDKIIALRPVEVHSADYALREYELTPSELDQFSCYTDAFSWLIRQEKVDHRPAGIQTRRPAPF